MSIVTIYHRNGQIRETRPIENGTIDGVVKRYSEDGFLASEIPYVNGVIHGLKKRFYPDGIIKAEIPYDKGLIHGIKCRFNKQGFLFEKIRYNRGEYEKQIFFDSYLASGLTEDEKNRKIRQEEIFDKASSIFKNIYDYGLPNNAYNPSKVITDDDETETIGEVLERPKEKRIIDPLVESFTHPEENGRFIKERIDRGVIVGNSDFTSETVTSFEITYFKGENQKSTAISSKRPVKEYPITVWIEKGNGIEFKTRVWIRNGKWFGRFITSQNITWEYYMWVLFQKFNILEWKTDRGTDANPGEYGSIRIYSKEYEKKISWICQKPESWDEFLTFFNRFFGKNTRTSYEEGLFLSKEQEIYFDNGGSIKYFCQAKAIMQNLQKPDDIFYPKDTMSFRCPRCGCATNYKDYRNHSKRFCHKCYTNVCTEIPLPKNVELTDLVSSVRIEFATDQYFTESTVGFVFETSKEGGVYASYDHLDKGDWERFSYKRISDNDWREFLDILFNKAFCHEWAQTYLKYGSHMYDGACDSWGYIKIRFKNFSGYKKIVSHWTGKEPPYWDVVVESVQQLIYKLK